MTGVPARIFQELDNLRRHVREGLAKILAPLRMLFNAYDERRAAQACFGSEFVIDQFMRVAPVSRHLQRDIERLAEHHVCAHAEIPLAGIAIHPDPLEERVSLLVILQERVKLMLEKSTRAS